MIISRGAEAVLIKKDNEVVKERIRKGYRVAELDESLRKSRTRTEASLLREARRAGVLTPHVNDVSDFTIEMAFVDGEKVRDVMNEKNCVQLSEKIGAAVANMHKFGIIHGDLTTSNMILSVEGLYFIDFGLGFHSAKVEDKAVDLHLLHQALESTHFSVAEKAWNIILKVYAGNYKESPNIIKRLSAIEKRGRYKSR